MESDGLTIDIGINTNLLSSKLKVIARHATALAEDLDRIDRATCPKCGSTHTETVTGWGDIGEVLSTFNCTDCSYTMNGKGYAVDG